MTSRLAVERKFFEQHPGGVFDEAWHKGRQQIVSFERALANLPQFECPLEHFFVDGLYVRQIFIPKGVALVGYVHMQPCITTVSRGTILINDGGKTVQFSAPYTVCVPPGSKKAGYALEDTVWSDAYINLDNERDIATLEARLIAVTHEEFLLRTGQLQQVESK